MSLARFFSRRASHSASRSLGHAHGPTSRCRVAHRPHVELLEDRTLLSGWAVATVGGGDDPLARDADGNLYITGQFTGTADFDPGPGTYNLTSAGGAIGPDIFVAKYTSAGGFLWAKRMGSNSTITEVGNAITVDASNNVYVTGNFGNSADFGPFTLTSAGSSDVFVTKLDTNGNFLWAHKVGGTDVDTAHGIATDSNGSSYITGRFKGAVDFDPGAGTFTLTSAGGDDVFVLKLDSGGSFVWATRAGGAGINEVGAGVAVDASGNAYVTGRFMDMADFGSINLTSSGNRDAFVAKLDSTGNFTWAKRMGSSTLDVAYGLTLDTSGNILCTGSFTGLADFGATTLNSVGADDIFVVKLDSTGNFSWAQAMGGPSQDWGWAITADAAGNIYTTGKFQGTADFDPGVDTGYLTAQGSDEMFVSKLSASGNFVWARRMGGQQSDQGRGVTVDTAGNVYTAGTMGGPADFDVGASTVLLNSGAFLAKTTQEAANTLDLGVLYDSPDPAARGGPLTLSTAHVRVISGSSTVASVSFYRDKNGNGALEVGTDTLLGTDTDVSNGWSLATTAPSKNGIYTYFAQAKDSSNAIGNVVSARNRIGPGGPVAAMVVTRDTRAASVDAVIASHYFNNDDRENNLTLPERLDRHTLRDLLRARGSR